MWVPDVLLLVFVSTITAGLLAAAFLDDKKH